MRFVRALVLAALLTPTVALGADPSGKGFQVDGLDPAVLETALARYRQEDAHAHVARPLLTIIDFTRPSTEKRLWVIDPQDGHVLFRELVAHGKGSGELYARRFGNRNETHESSLGLFRTAETYQGKHGYSLRLDGLDPGVNDRARERDIVIHGAGYVSDAFATEHGRLGRSFGCPALDEHVARAVIDTIKDGSLVFAWGRDRTALAAAPEAK